MDPLEINISVGELEVTGTLNNSSCSSQIWELLPITSNCNTWGDEIYFPIDLSFPEDSNSTEVVDSGTLAFWPPGNAFCIFYGKTPASNGDEIRAASPVNIIGSISGDEKVFRSIAPGTKITISKASK